MLILIAMAGLYFHIPFCKRICAYCDFYKSVETARLPETLQAMHRELESRREYLGGEAVRTRYFGGGTPSLCTPEQLRALLDHAAGLFDCSATEETTLEANPDDLTPRYLDALREAGIDRLSIGIQSLDDDCLRLMNRRHTARQAVEAVRAARKAGFGNLTVDLIFGVPGFGGDSLRRTLDGILALEAEHVSAYHLTVEPDTAFGRRAARGSFRPVEEQVSEEEFLTVHRTLTGAGYEHYEVSNFARCPLLRRAGASLERRLRRPLHRRRRGRSGAAHRARPLQRVPAHTAAHGRGDLPRGAAAALRCGTRRAAAARGRPVDCGRHAAHFVRTHGRSARTLPRQQRGHRIAVRGLMQGPNS